VTVVFDTNVVLSAIVFSGRLSSAIRYLWRSGRVTPVASDETVSELVRVLRYPKFRLSAEDQVELLSDYIPFLKRLEHDRIVSAPLSCSDSADQPFLDLAFSAAVDALVTGDPHLLDLSHELESNYRLTLRIVRPAELVAQFEELH
jgi:putative PIN family toxin of toxin-antitoxin system